jgi:prevent-host-death family protein
MQVTMKEAKNRFTELARRAEAGEAVTVTRHGKPVCTIAPTPQKKGGVNFAAGEAWFKKNGIDRSKFWIAYDFDAPLDPETFEPIDDLP